MTELSTQKNRRIKLNNILENILGSKNVYFEPPTNIKMKYPAIVYELENIYSIRADDIAYNNTRAYQVTVIGKDPDTDILDKLLELKKCSYQRRFTSDNLIHDVFRLYY